MSRICLPGPEYIDVCCLAFMKCNPFLRNSRNHPASISGTHAVTVLLPEKTKREDRHFYVLKNPSALLLCRILDVFFDCNNEITLLCLD